MDTETMDLDGDPKMVTALYQNENDDRQSQDERGDRYANNHEKETNTGRNIDNETDDDDGSDGDESAKNNERTLVWLLRECEEEIHRLRSQLDEQQTLKASLERRLEHTRASTSAALISPESQSKHVITATSIAKRVTIAHLPRELLMFIFSHLIRDNPLAIGPALFVCRYWNDIIYKTPTMWSNISASFTTDLSAIHRQGSYLRSAVLYSSTAPIRIDIGLPSFRDFMIHMAMKLLPPTSYYQIHGDAGLRTDLQRTVEWLERHLGDLERNGFVPYQNLDNAIGAAIHSLTSSITQQSTNLGHLHRIQSFRINVPASQFSRCLSNGFLQIFSRPTPILTDLVVVLHEFRVLMSSFTHPIPSLVRVSWKARWPLQAIMIPNKPVNMEGNDDLLTEEVELAEEIGDGQPTQRSQLRHLRLWIDQTFANIPHSRYLTAITYLFLDCGVLHQDWGVTPIAISLPSLQDLGLLGPGPGLQHFLHALSAPKLTTLRLFDHLATFILLDESPPFPTIRKLHTFWSGNIQDLAVDILLSRFQHLREIGIIYSVEGRAKVNEASMQDWLRKVGEAGVSTQVCRAPSSDEIWSFDCNDYEYDEIPLTV